MDEFLSGQCIFFTGWQEINNKMNIVHDHLIDER